MAVESRANSSHAVTQCASQIRTAVSLLFGLQQALPAIRIQQAFTPARWATLPDSTIVVNVVLSWLMLLE